MLDYIKKILRITGTDFDDEIQSIIDDCLAELTMLGIYDAENHSTTEGNVTTYDPQIQACVSYYAKWKFGDNDTAEKWELIYKDKITKLKIAHGYGGGASG